MKRQIVFGFTGALILGAFLAMGACNKHSFKDTEFDTGTQAVFKPHGGDHGDDHGSEGAHGESDGHGHEHDSDKGAHHKGEDGDKHDKSHDSKKEHKEASKQPAKTLFPKK